MALLVFARITAQPTMRHSCLTQTETTSRHFAEINSLSHTGSNIFPAHRQAYSGAKVDIIVSIRYDFFRRCTMSKYSRSGGKYSGNHTTLIPAASILCDIAH